MSALPSVTMTGVGASAPILIKLHESPHWQAPPNYSIGLICILSSGATITYSVQLTGDQQPSASGNWIDETNLSSKTASAYDTLSMPVTGIRLNISSYTSGTATLAVTKFP